MYTVWWICETDDSMGMRENLNKKLCQATCGKIELDRQVLRTCKCLKEVEETIDCEKKEKEKWIG